jgi:hypothetical protein
MNNRLELGTWNAICDVCGFKKKANELKKRWDGLMVCPEDFETRHMSDLYKAPVENQGIPWSRPQGTDNFVTVNTVAANVGKQDNNIPAGTFNSNTL